MDESRTAWQGGGPRRVRTYVWRPETGGVAADLVWIAQALVARGFLVAASSTTATTSSMSSSGGLRLLVETAADMRG